MSMGHPRIARVRSAWDEGTPKPHGEILKAPLANTTPGGWDTRSPVPCSQRCLPYAGYSQSGDVWAPPPPALIGQAGL
jgi:hypothetical protein